MDETAGEKVTIEIETNKDSTKIDTCFCAVKAMVGNPAKLATVGHIPRESSRHFLKQEGGKLESFVFSTECRPLPIPAGRLEIPLILSFKSPGYLTHQKIKNFLLKFPLGTLGLKTTTKQKFKTKKQSKS